MISLECEYLTYDDGPTALADIALTVEAGEQVHVVGPSGSGKTSLARLLAGRTGGDAGTIFRGALTLGGIRLEFEDGVHPRIDPAAWSSRVGYVAQGAWGQLSMMSSTVAEEIAFGPANLGVKAGQLRTTVQDIAARLHLTDLLDRDPRTLSGGELQKTVIAAALASEPRVLILDEPFQGLDAGAAADVAAALERLRSAGTGLVICEPLLPERPPGHTRVLALFEGRGVFEGTLADARRAGLRRYGIALEGDPPRLRSRITGSGHPHDPASDDASMHRPDVPATGPKDNGVLAELRGVSFTYPGKAAGTPAGISGIDFRVDQGEVVALRGPNGSGKSTLLQHLNGLLRPTSGSVWIDGRTLGSRSTGELAAKVGYLFQNTDQQLFERTVLREVAYGPRAAGRKREAALEQARLALAEVGLPDHEGLHPYELDFVRRRLVAMASMIATRPRLWVLDEPTAGLDDVGRNRMAELILAHAASGGGVVLATHDTAFAHAVSDRTVTLEGGRVPA